MIVNHDCLQKERVKPHIVQNKLNVHFTLIVFLLAKHIMFSVFIDINRRNQSALADVVTQHLQLGLFQVFLVLFFVEVPPAFKRAVRGLNIYLRCVTLSFAAFGAYQNQALADCLVV
jgi:hypothetical protein